jgi:[protein-PII] uridylyltransferase
MAFCLEHGMTRYDARLVSWLVRQHLLLSMTAQKQDVNDPRVINEFAKTVGDQAHLDYLYVLTVADVRATNPDIWNSWKDTLFWELYKGTKRALRRGEADPIDRDELIAENKERAAEILSESPIASNRWRSIWNELNDEYFLRHRAEEVAWHTEVLARKAQPDSTIIDISNSIADGLTVLMVYSNNRRSYVTTTGILDAMGLDVVDARIIPVGTDRHLNTYCVLDDAGEQISDRAMLVELKSRLERALADGAAPAIQINRRMRRQVRVFSTPVQISMTRDSLYARTVIELVAADRPGLLYQVGRVFDGLDIELQNARVATIGERAEDVFFVTTTDHNPLDEAQCAELKAALVKALTDGSPQPAH